MPEIDLDSGQITAGRSFTWGGEGGYWQLEALDTVATADLWS